MSFVKEPTIILEKNIRTKNQVELCLSRLRYQAQAAAQVEYETILKSVGAVERLVSGSDDFTMFLWEPHKQIFKRAISLRY